jgi:hypothetical protein
MLTLAMRENRRIMEEKRKKSASATGIVRKDLVDKKASVRPATVLDVGTDEEDGAIEEAPPLRPLNREAIGSLIKEMI